MPAAAWFALLLVLTPPTAGVATCLYLARWAPSWGWRVFWGVGVLLAVEVGVVLARAGWQVGYYEAAVAQRVR